MAALGTPPPSSDITPEPLYLRRREFIKNSLLFSATAAGVGGSLLWLTKGGRATTNAAPQATDAATHAGQVAADGGKVAGPSPALQIARRSPLSTDEPPTSSKDVTTYNNFYEFGTDKDGSGANAGIAQPRPWTVAVEGEVASRGPIDIDTLLKLVPPRGARLPHALRRGVVDGDPVGRLPARRSDQAGRADLEREVCRVHDPARPGAAAGSSATVLDWPYVEGLRMDEAMHPLTILAVGLYGKVLPNQNGAPLRLVVPWKYGFKGIKSIVKIRFTETQPRRRGTRCPHEYGFYANVNPRSIIRAGARRPSGASASSRRATLPFNGYADQVASLYSGMDLRNGWLKVAGPSVELHASASARPMASPKGGGQVGSARGPAAGQ